MKISILPGILKTVIAVTFLISANTLVAQNPGMPTPSETVVDVINESEDHTILASLLVDAGFDRTLSQPGSYTIVAPTDAAFVELGESLSILRQSPEQLQEFLLGHLFQGVASADDIEESLDVEVITSIETPDNGVVHITDEVVNRLR